MQVEQIVGQRIRDRRVGQEMTQEQLGQRVGLLLGREWSRQAVSTAERGGRAFTATELVAIAHVLGTSIGRMFTPPPASEGVELPAGITLSRDELVAAALPRLSAPSMFEDMRKALAELLKGLRIAYQGTELAVSHIQSLEMMLDLASEIASFPTVTADEALDPEDES